jgi:hypothetical protein
MDIMRLRPHFRRPQWHTLRPLDPATLGWVAIGIPLVHVTLGTPDIGLVPPMRALIGLLHVTTDIAITADTGAVKLRFATKRARAASTIDGYFAL